jgi:hypothetical protein
MKHIYRHALTIIFSLSPLLLFGQETTTYRVDSVGRNLWLLTSTTRYDRPDSTFYESKMSERFRSRAALRQHVRTIFAERIAADSASVENLKRRIAGLKAQRAGLLHELRPASGQQAQRQAPAPAAAEPPKQPQQTTKKKKKQ